MKKHVITLLLMLSPILLVLSPCATAQSQVPQTMNYQGYLTDQMGIPVADGPYALSFRIYNIASGGVALWTENHSAVQVTKGLFSVVLGAAANPNPLVLPFDAQYYLGITIGTEIELTPRVRLNATPYSVRARVADGVKDGAITDAGVAAGAGIAASKLDPLLVTEADMTAGTGISITKGGAVTVSLDASGIALAGDVTGSVAATTIGNDKVTAGMIQPDIVSSIDGVSNDGRDIDLVAGANVTIIPDDAANTITIAATPSGSGFSLPYSGTIADAASAFAVEQTGGGGGGMFKITNAGSGKAALRVTTNSTDILTGHALRAESESGSALVASSNGAAPAILAYNSSGGIAAGFGGVNSYSGDIVKIMRGGGSGNGLSIENPGGGKGIYLQHSSSNFGFELLNTGGSTGAYIHTENTTANQPALGVASNGTMSALVVNNTSATQSVGHAIEAFSAAANGLLVASGGTGATVKITNNNADLNAYLIRAFNGGMPINQEIFSVKRSGETFVYGVISPSHMNARDNVGPTGTPDYGAYYKDNAIGAWAAVKADGTFYSDFGCASVSKTGTGTYVITYDHSFATCVPIATAFHASSFRLCIIKESGASSATVIVVNSSASLQDCDFFFMLTGRP